MASKDITEFTVPEETLVKIREVFLEKFKEKIDKNAYHPLDVERVKKNTDWVRCFFKHGLGDSDKTVQVADDVLTWRNTFNANSLLTPGKLPFKEVMLADGGLFMRNKDKNGRPFLHFAVKNYKKGKYSFEENCRYIAYFLEKEYKFSINSPLILFFDMTGAGMSGADLEMSKFLVYCLKTYYPGLVEYVLVYDIPMVFKAIWQIIKLLLPAEAVDLVKFVDKKTVKQYADESQIPVHMGGTDQYVFDVNDPSLYVTENLDLQ